MLQFEYMQRALLAGFLLSVIIPMIGVVMVSRKTSMIGDALSHVSLAGVGLGLILAIEPLAGAIGICIFAGLLIELFRKRFPQYGDMATAVIMSIGLGLASILSDLAPGGNSFESYLFGSISSVTPADLKLIIIVSILVVFASLALYASLMDLSIDTEMARISGVKVRFTNIVFTIFSAITVAIACKIIGALLVSSLLVLPVATSLLLTRSYAQTYRLSILLGVIYTLSGITLSFYFDLRPGGTIVLCAVAGMLILALISKVRKVYTKDVDIQRSTSS